MLAKQLPLPRWPAADRAGGPPGPGSPSCVRGCSRVLRRHVRWQRAGQTVQQEVAGAEVGRSGPDALAGDEFEGGPCGQRGPAVDVEPHSQRRAQWPPGQADFDPVYARVAIVLDRPADQALTIAQFAVLSRALPAFKGGHARLERDVNDPPER